MEMLHTLGNKMPALVLAGGIGCAAIAGCGADVINDKPATVVEHIYEPSYVSIISTGKSVIPIFHAAEYDLKVRQCGREGDSDADKQGCVTSQVEVSKATWNQYKDGSTIVFHNK